MAKKERGKKKKAAPKRERRERRFLPDESYASWLSAGVGMAGALALGAGVFGQWIRAEPFPHAPYLIAAGAAGLIAGLWLAMRGVYPIRVGDAGVAIERGNGVERLAWCDIDKIMVEGRNFVVRGPEMTLSLPLAAHHPAAARIVAEAERRMPVLLRIDAAARAELQAAESKGDEQELLIEDVQVAGRRCAASDKVIAFERDARFCPMCGQVYHKEHVPERCGTCETEVGRRAFAA